MEKLPYVALSKTYTRRAGRQLGAHRHGDGDRRQDKNDMIGVNSEVEVGDCAGSKGKEVPSLAEMAERAGQATGVVSTARLTHATPAAIYSHTPNRDWEADVDMPPEAIAAGCKDIAQQLVDWSHGDGFEVAIGGGRDRFLPETMDDPEDADKKGARKDGRDLVQEWLTATATAACSCGTRSSSTSSIPRPRMSGPLRALAHAVRGRPREGQRRRAVAGGDDREGIDMLSQNPKGFFLMVEGGRIDHAHHDSNAYRSLEDTVAFDKAIKAALEKVNLEETLVIVTADHSHTFTINGYPKRGNPILGHRRAGRQAQARQGWQALHDAGLRQRPGRQKEGEPRPVPTNTTAPDYIQQALVPLESETHGGEDVASSRWPLGASVRGRGGAELHLPRDRSCHEAG